MRLKILRKIGSKGRGKPARFHSRPCWGLRTPSTPISIVLDVLSFLLSGGDAVAPLVSVDKL